LLKNLLRHLPWKELVSAAPNFVNTARNIFEGRVKNPSKADRFAGISAMEAVEMLQNDFDRFVHSYREENLRLKAEIDKLKKKFRVLLTLSLVTLAGIIILAYIYFIEGKNI